MSSSFSISGHIVRIRRVDFFTTWKREEVHFALQIIVPDKPEPVTVFVSRVNILGMKRVHFSQQLIHKPATIHYIKNGQVNTHYIVFK